MMTITLTPELEQAVAEDARKRGIAPEDAAMNALRERFLPVSPAADTGDALSEWEQMMRDAAAQIAAVSDGEHAGLAALDKEQL